MDTSLEYIKGLNLVDSSDSFDIFNSLETDAETPSYLNYKSLLSFASDVSERDKDDVMDSMLLAQRAASKAHGEEKDGILWYKKYFEVLENLGWLISTKEFNSIDTKDTLLELDKTIISLVSDLLTGQQVSLLKKSLELIKSLGEDDQRLIAFERNAHSHNRGNFQLGMADATNGNVSVVGSGFMLESDKKINKILFINLNDSSVKIKFNFYKAEFVNSAYARYRDAVKNKLGDTNNFIATLDI